MPSASLVVWYMAHCHPSAAVPVKLHTVRGHFMHYQVQSEKMETILVTQPHVLPVQVKL